MDSQYEGMRTYDIMIQAEGNTFAMALREDDLESFKQARSQSSWRMVSEGKLGRNEVEKVVRA